MAAADDNRNTERKEGILQMFPVAGGEHIYQGTLVKIVDSEGYAYPAEDASGAHLAGVAQNEVDNTDGSDGDEYVVCWREGTYHFDVVDTWSVDESWVNANVYVSDDQTVADDSDVSNNLLAGVVEEVEDDGSVWVNIEPATREGYDSSPATTTTS